MCEPSFFARYCRSGYVRIEKFIMKENLYFFLELSYARAYDKLKKTCDEVGLVAPVRITSVSMRKYMATLTQVNTGILSELFVIERVPYCFLSLKIAFMVFF